MSDTIEPVEHPRNYEIPGWSNADAINARDATIREQDAEIERLTTALKIANANHEHFERHWYLRGDEIERLRAVLVAAKGLNAESEEYDFDYGLGRAAPNSYWEELDDAIEAIDAAKEQR